MFLVAIFSCKIEEDTIDDGNKAIDGRETPTPMYHSFKITNSSAHEITMISFFDGKNTVDKDLVFFLCNVSSQFCLKKLVMVWFTLIIKLQIIIG